MNDENQSFTKDKPKSHKSSNIVLVGLTGSGKSTIGWLLSKQIGYGFIDLDSWVEKIEGKKIAEIFSETGEGKFRELESKAVSGISNVKNHVVSIGSGALVSNENYEIIKSMGTVIWIDCPVEEVIFRLSRLPEEIEKRPLLSDLLHEEDETVKLARLKERLVTLLAQRKDKFERADIVFYDSYSTTDGSVKQLKNQLFEKGIIRNTLPRFVNKQD